MKKWILASTLVFSSVSQAALDIATKDVLKALLNNSANMELVGELSGQNLNEVLAGYFSTNIDQPKGKSVTINSVSSSCEYVGQTVVMKCSLHLYSEIAKVVKGGYKKDAIGESSIILFFEVTRTKNGLEMLNTKVDSALAE